MRLAFALFALLGFAAAAQPSDPEWLDSKPAGEFRARVVQLALIYGESSGIDLRGFKVVARLASKEDTGCADVEVVTQAGQVGVRREIVRACRSH